MGGSPTTEASPPLLVVFRTRHSPHKLVFFGLALLWGVAYLAPSPQVLMPSWLVSGWAAGMLIHGLAGFAAVLAPRRRIEQALLVELGSMMFGSGALLLMAIAVWHYQGIGRATLLGGGFFAAWTVANAYRGRQITRDLHQMRSRA